MVDFHLTHNSTLFAIPIVSASALIRVVCSACVLVLFVCDPDSLGFPGDFRLAQFSCVVAQRFHFPRLA